MAAVAWGILGTARTNRRFLGAVGESDAARVAAVGSREADRASAYASEWAIPRAHGSYEALLEDPEIEAVYVSLPNSLHLEWSLRALAAGKHVLCEKPLSVDPLAVEEAFDAAERAGRLLTEGLMYRHHPQTRLLRELVARGAIGAPLGLRTVFTFPVADPRNIRLSPVLQGGALMDVGCYCADICRIVAGEPGPVSGFQTIGPTGVDTRFAGTIRFEAGALAQFIVGLDLAKSMGFEVVGEEATLIIRDPWHCREPGIEIRAAGSSAIHRVAAGDPYLLQLEDACAAIRGKSRPLLRRRDSVEQARLLGRLRAAAESAG